VDALFDAYKPFFDEFGGVRVESSREAGRIGKVPFFFILTGGTEGIVLDTLKDAWAIQAQPHPVVLLAHPRHNSLPAALEIAARVRQDGYRAVLILVRNPEDKEARTAMRETLFLLESMHRMRSSIIGMVGKPSDWLIASSQGPENVKAIWGVDLIPIDPAELKSKTGDAAIDVSMLDKAAFCIEPNEADRAASNAIYRALKAIVVARGLSALTLRCFDLVLNEKATGCVALSRLSDEGIDAGCEGDVAAIVALRWMRILTEKPAWMANPSDIAFDRAKGKATLLLAHCTVPTTLVASFGLRSHFESGLGIAIAGEFSKQPVTLVRLGGDCLEESWIVEGTLIESPSMEGLCRTQAQVEIDLKDAEDLVSKPLGNHLVMAFGSYAAIAQKYLKMAGIGSAVRF
jgi:L-fucose isomerase-like protein